MEQTNETMLAVIDYDRERGSWTVTRESGTRGDQVTGFNKLEYAKALQVEWMNEYGCEGTCTAAAQAQIEQKASEQCRGECQEHQGFANYETFGFYTTTMNDQETADKLSKLARRIRGHAPDRDEVRDGTWTEEEAARFWLADRLKDEYEEAAEQRGGYGTVWGSLLGAALGRVDWQQVAQGLLNNIKEEDEHESNAEVSQRVG